MRDTARDFHFVFGLRAQHEPFHLVHYLCLASCRRVYPDSVINLHLRHQPHGPWWERILPQLRIHRLPAAQLPFDAARYASSAEGRYILANGYDYAHEADFLRLQILLDHGGIYADMDTLFVKRYPAAFFAGEFALAEEGVFPGPRGVLRPSLCNALMIARPGAAFARAWLARMGEVFDGTWNRHSCDEAARLWSEQPTQVRLLPQRAFYAFAATRNGLAALFERREPLPRDCCSIHLWAHLWWHAQRVDFTSFHAGLITTGHIRNVDSTYNHIARALLPESAFA